MRKDFDHSIGAGQAGDEAREGEQAPIESDLLNSEGEDLGTAMGVTALGIIAAVGAAGLALFLLASG